MMNLSTDLAISIAKNSSHPKHKHAALIFCDGELIVYANNHGNYHAERKALDICHMLGYFAPGYKLVLISIAITKGGKLKLAKPCRNCEYYIRKKKIEQVFYSTKEQRIVKL